jgi:tripartite-type tricarboxylate transporter receptor subunit TctC
MALAVGLACSAVSALAQQYPTRPIRFVQGFAAGGNADVITRVLGAEMSKSLGQPVIFDARVGAGGNIAAEQVARAEPDGYTLLLVTTAHLVSPALYNSLGYDSINDFAFISSVTNVPFFVVTHAESPYNLGGFPKSSTAEEATERVKKEIPLWKELAEKAGIPKR